MHQVSGDSAASTDQSVPSPRTGFAGWLKQTKPADLLTVLLSSASVVVAIVALVTAERVSNQQAEAAAPVLAPGTSFALRGQQLKVFTDYSFLVKVRTGFLWIVVLVV